MEGENFQIIREMTGKNWQITKRGGWNKRRGWNIFMKSTNVEGGFYFVEGEILQIIREMTEMTGKNCQITKCEGWNIFIKSINVEGEFFLWRVEFFKIGKHGLHVY